MTCGICHDGGSNPFVTSCGHRFCCDCIRRHLQSAESFPFVHCPSCLMEVAYTDSVTLLGPEVVQGMVSEFEKLLRDQIAPKPKTLSTPCAACGEPGVPFSAISTLSYKTVQGALKTRGLKRTRSKADGVKSLKKLVGKTTVVCVSCPNTWTVDVVGDLKKLCLKVDGLKLESPPLSTSKKQEPGNAGHQTRTVRVKGTGYGGSAADNKTSLVSSRILNKNLQSEMEAKLNGLMDHIPYVTASVYAVLNGATAVLNEFLLGVMNLNDSILDIELSSTHSLYEKVFKFLRKLSACPELGQRVLGLPTETVLVRKLEYLFKQVNVLMSRSQDKEDLSFAKNLCDCYNYITENIIQPIAPAISSSEQNLVSSTSTSCDPSARQAHVENLKALQFRLLSPEETNGQFNHYFRNHSSKTPTPAQMRRILKEFGSLSVSLPLQWESSVHLCAEEENLQLLKTLIIGPEGTPYQNGIFLFDVLLPSTYPQVPPQVQFLTTGGGTVRFNPNLYANGMVCLSLLGTWGANGWTPGESTLLQVMVSIQSLILVKDPFYNEPGYEAYKNQAGVEAENAMHRRNTLSVAILGALLNPDKMFEQVIHEHFRAKRQNILSQCDEWIKLAKDKSALQITTEKIKDELAKFS